MSILSNLNFFGCKHTNRYVTIYDDNIIDTILIKVSVSNLVLLKCIFERTYTNAISARDSNITISQTIFRDYDIHFSEDILLFDSCNVMIINSCVYSHR